MYRTISKKTSVWKVKELVRDEKYDEYSKFVVGTTKHIYEGLGETSCSILLMFCNEGENVPHSFDMAVRCLTQFSLKAELIPPPSWVNFYGPPMQEELLM